MNLREITTFLESLAPPAYQESYDNSGLIVGHLDNEISGALISLDCTEAVVDEAIALGLNFIISHHPIVFKGLKKFNGNSYIERVVIKAIKHDIALYAIHTNLDHAANGVNKKICDKLGIKTPSFLKHREDSLRKLVTFCPHQQAEKLRDAMFKAGAGNIGKYSEASFNTAGIGTFKPGEGSKPFVGILDKQHQEPETRMEFIYSVHLENKILEALFTAHPYEELAYDLYPLINTHPQLGSGMIGDLDRECDELDFLHFIKESLGVKVIRHTALRNKKIRKVAVCGGSGSFLLAQAISAGADIFISSDFKYHEFFDAERKLIIADVGHFESEQFTQELLLDIITEKFSNFAIRLTTQNTNPINYLI